MGTAWLIGAIELAYALPAMPSRLAAVALVGGAGRVARAVTARLFRPPS